MKRLVLTGALTAILVISGWPSEAHPPYGPNVRHARQWLKERTTDRAFRCADTLWDRESHWSVHSTNRWSGAYGIPQAVPGSKMASAERPHWGRHWDDWRHDALVQVAWGRNYVKARYGSFCGALRFQTAWGWY